MELRIILDLGSPELAQHGIYAIRNTLAQIGVELSRVPGLQQGEEWAKRRKKGLWDIDPSSGVVLEMEPQRPGGCWYIVSSTKARWNKWNQGGVSDEEA